MRPPPHQARRRNRCAGRQAGNAFLSFLRAVRHTVGPSPFGSHRPPLRFQRRGFFLGLGGFEGLDGALASGFDGGSDAKDDADGGGYAEGETDGFGCKYWGNLS